jgi:hypothetical protein
MKKENDNGLLTEMRENLIEWVLFIFIITNIVFFSMHGLIPRYMIPAQVCLIALVVIIMGKRGFLDDIEIFGTDKRCKFCGDRLRFWQKKVAGSHKYCNNMKLQGFKGK